jgi:hypothetical protein
MRMGNALRSWRVGTGLGVVVRLATMSASCELRSPWQRRGRKGVSKRRVGMVVLLLAPVSCVNAFAHPTRRAVHRHTSRASAAERDRPCPGADPTYWLDVQPRSAGVGLRSC